MRWAAHGYLPEDAEAAEARAARRVSINGVGEEVLDRGHGDHVANVLALLVRVRVRVRFGFGFGFGFGFRVKG